ncbi:MAG: DUF2088 domain-containing protein [Clostridia bacterium]|nr:DUF2088 domain-containing protein [Clostridia bacterium]
MRFPRLDYKSLCDDLELPQMVKVRQKFSDSSIEDPAGYLREQLRALDPSAVAGLRGKRIGITAGSRGLPHYKELMKAMCDQLKEWGAQPFVFPAMGSHAGATGEGQKAHLAQFGVCEEYLGVPVLSTMDVVTVETLDDGFPVYCDKNAYEADGIIIFNKIKPHTHFKYKHESGLLKMICIGVGKHMGAATFHAWGYDDFGPNLERVTKAFLDKVNVVFSVGMVQSPSDEISCLEVIPTDRFFERDAALQAIAKKEMPRLKLPRIDVLVIDRVGKEISGAGMDPNVTGRTERQSQFAGFQEIAPDIEKIVLLDITDAAHGNATGAGVADIISHRFANKIDFSSTYTNIITAKSFRMGAMPLYANSDLDAIRLAAAHSFLRDTSEAKIVRIKNTLMLEDIECSVGCMEEIAAHEDMEIVSEPYAWSFNEEGNFW